MMNAVEMVFSMSSAAWQSDKRQKQKQNAIVRSHGFLVVGLLAAVFSRSDTKNTNRTLLRVFVSSENTMEESKF